MRSLLAAGLCGGLVLSASMPVGAQGSDAQARRREVQRQRAAKAAQIDGLKASDADLVKALDTLDANVRRAQSQAAEAASRANAAEVAAAAAAAVERATAGRIAELERRLKASAVREYIHGGFASALTALDAKNASDVTLRQTLIQQTVGSAADAADRLRVERDDLAAASADARRAARIAADRRRQTSQLLAQATGAQMAKQRLVDSVETRLDAALSEADSLASLDKTLAAQIAQQQADLARRVGAGGSGGTRPRSSGPISLTTVRGIEVASQIADRLDAMLAAAQRDGFSYGGGGYRNSDQQVAARRANCGSSDYDIYDKPPSECSPPTARPGSSMHEQGLAIDFTWNGSVINSRSSPAYQWLNSNASTYGFYNLPSEAWHWSVNGN